MNRVGSCDTPEHLGAQCLKFGTVRFCCPEVPKLLRPGLCPISSPARMTPSSQPYPPPVHFPPAARAAPLKLSMLLTPCSAPHPPMAPHFSWGKSQSPQGPEALPDPALPPPQPLLPPNLTFSPSPPSLPPASLASSLFLEHRVSQPQYYWHFGPNHSFLAVGGCPVHSRIFNCISRLYPLDASSMPPSPASVSD